VATRVPGPVLTDPTGLIIAGDIHSDPRHLAYLYEVAVQTRCEAIVVVGDFGYVEHYDQGAFLAVAEEGFRLTTEHGWPVELLWLDGNHENHPLLHEKYGPNSPIHEASEEGFWKMREGVHYIPRATRWNWAGISFLALGGAYSIDKMHLLKLQRQDGGERWWPTEEITDDDVAKCLSDRSPVDVMLTHDKPRDVQVPWSRRDIPLALPNQDKIQRVVNALHPKLLVHGHLHIRYQSKVDRTIVEGLGCNPHKDSDDPADSWIRLSLV